MYDLELADEMTDIYVDLVTRVDVMSKRYWELVKTLAEVEVERDKLREKLIGSGKYVKAINHLMKQNRALLGKLEEERKLCKKAEEDANYLARDLDEERCQAEQLRGELEEERRLRLDAEYDRELYAMQLAEHSTNDINDDYFFFLSKGEKPFEKNFLIFFNFRLWFLFFVRY